ncbi:hypothetical protein D0A34_23680 [Microcoleus vaginatus PCC 9802]|uniref:hypothetical protein n=1 Tax=Microcoleus vaginatus TaxID=119532 RepID=UPI00020D109C|nr:hypothetical protein MicvaDRAFT_1749 [Microcoleus vaginatus FGP-2]UNU21447.1 hypothetical protein D0A34_23680 [Microcoleus vaginatus PCC 9802]
MHYTLDELKQKTLKELKQIGYQLNVLPDDDRRYARNWVNALVGKQPPLLQLLEASPVAEVEPVQEPIEPQAQEPPLESKFGRIVYPKPATKPIAQNAETEPQLARTEGADVHHWRSHPAESVRDSDGAQAEALGIEKGDRVLVVAGNHQAGRGGVLPDQSTQLTTLTEGERPPNRGDNGRDRLESEAKVRQSAIVQAAKNSPGVKSKSTAHQLLELFKSSAHIIPDSPADEEVTESAIGQTPDPNLILTGCTLSSEFLARYSPPQPQIIHFQSDADGQLSLLDFEVESTDEPPDPDDFDSLDAFNEAMARWDAENAEALTISNDSMCEWAPCPDEWYEPEAGIMPLKASSMPESSSTCNFSIPTFDAWCDRANRQTDSDEPPDTGIFARLPKPKPPNFPPMASALKQIAYQSHNSHITVTYQTDTCRVATGRSSQSGRAPPGGDAH